MLAVSFTPAARVPARVVVTVMSVVDGTSCGTSSLPRSSLNTATHGPPAGPEMATLDAPTVDRASIAAWTVVLVASRGIAADGADPLKERVNGAPPGLVLTVIVCCSLEGRFGWCGVRRRCRSAL